MPLTTLRLDVRDVTPRIVYDTGYPPGAPTGPPHFTETVLVGGTDALTEDNSSTFVRIKGGGYDASATSSSGDWGTRDGFDATFEPIPDSINWLNVQYVNVRYTASATVEYVDSPWNTEPPVSNPVAGLFAVFTRPVGVPGYRGSLLYSGVLNSQGWVEAGRAAIEVGPAHTGAAYVGLAQNYPPNLVSALTEDSGWMLTIMASGSSASEVATLTIEELYLEVTYYVSPAIEGNLGDSRSRFS